MKYSWNVCDIHTMGSETIDELKCRPWFRLAKYTTI